MRHNVGDSYSNIQENQGSPSGLEQLSFLDGDQYQLYAENQETIRNINLHTKEEFKEKLTGLEPTLKKSFEQHIGKSKEWSEKRDMFGGLIYNMLSSIQSYANNAVYNIGDNGESAGLIPSTQSMDEIKDVIELVNNNEININTIEKIVKAAKTLFDTIPNTDNQNRQKKHICNGLVDSIEAYQNEGSEKGLMDFINTHVEQRRDVNRYDEDTWREMAKEGLAPLADVVKKHENRKEQRNTLKDLENQLDHKTVEQEILEEKIGLVKSVKELDCPVFINQKDPVQLSGNEVQYTLSNTKNGDMEIAIEGSTDSVTEQDVQSVIDMIEPDNFDGIGRHYLSLLRQIMKYKKDNE